MGAAEKLVRVTAPSTPICKNEILCFLTVRNEILRLPAILDHHRRLGVSHFFIVDNGSVDGSREHLAEQPDVHLYTAEGSFSKNRFGFDWLHPLLDEFGSGHWVLIIDADELFTYPHYEQINLQRFADFLDSKDHAAVVAIMLDMYSSRSVEATTYIAGQSLIDVCPYFDQGTYQHVLAQTFPTFELCGGPRQRVFGNSATPIFWPTVSKVPFVKWRSGYRYISSTHHMWPSPPGFSDIFGALLHFKYLSDFPHRVREEAARGEHFDGAREYKLYLQKLQSEPSLTLHFEGSVRYRNSEHLIHCGLSRTSDAFEQFFRHEKFVSGNPTATIP